MEEKLQNIKDKILSYINHGEVKMKPKSYFVLRSILQGLSILIVFIAILYLASFVSLIMKEKDVLSFKPHELRSFLLGIPWMIVFLSLILLIVLEVLTRKFAFVYKKPIAYSLFATIVLVLVIGLILNKIDREFRFARFGEDPRAPILGPMHKYYRGEFDNRPFVKKFYKNKQRFENIDFRDLPLSPREFIPN